MNVYQECRYNIVPVVLYGIVIKIYKNEKK